MTDTHQHTSQSHTSASCCHAEQSAAPACHDTRRADWLLRISASLVTVLYLAFWLLEPQIRDFPWLPLMASSVFELINTMWWGIALGMLMVGLLSLVPREFVMAVLGSRPGSQGIVRATVAGVLLDLCSHGILMVGAKLYERGASTGQVMAFLIASPWNSFSLTLIMFALIGVPWTLTFIILSMLLAVITGVIFDRLVDRGVLNKNPNRIEVQADFRFWPEAKRGLSATSFNSELAKRILVNGIKDSRMVMRWILFGILLAALVRALMTEDHFSSYFGPTLAGLGLTLIMATIIEVCSEGSAPLAADLLVRAKAPGNSFAFLMTGVSTDYTEVMVLKDTTRSWKTALFLPLVTVPQVVVLAWLLNRFATG